MCISCKCIYFTLLRTPALYGVHMHLNLVKLHVSDRGYKLISRQKNLLGDLDVTNWDLVTGKCRQWLITQLHYHNYFHESR